MDLWSCLTLSLTIVNIGALPTSTLKDAVNSPNQAISPTYKPFSLRPTYAPGAPKLGPGWKVEEMPNPQVDTRACGRGGRVSFVCDPTNILTMDEADSLDWEINRFCQSLPRCICSDSSNNVYSRQCIAPSGCSGIKIAVAIVPTISNHHYQASVSPADVGTWARRLRTTQWNFGSCEDDIVIVLSKNDRQIYTSTGALAKKVLSDSCVNNYYKEVRDDLTIGDYGKGIKLLISKYREGLAKGSCNSRNSGSGGLSAGAIVAIIFAAVGGLLVVIVAFVCCLKNASPAGRSSGSTNFFSSSHYSSGGGGGGGCGGGGSSCGGGGGGSF